MKKNMLIENFMPRGGHHCITNSLKQIFEFNNSPISEAMLFGLGSGLSFVYVNLANAPMISGRIKPLALERNISDRLGVTIQPKTPKNSAVAMKSMKELLLNGTPVMVYVDMVYLKYLNLYADSHFGGHSIVVFGYDDNECCFYVSDRDNKDWSIHTPKGRISEDFHKVSYDEMEKARNSSFRPFPAKNKWVNFDFKDLKSITPIILRDSILINTQSMLNAPAQLLGINGIRKFAQEIKKWKTFNVAKKKLACITNYFMINADGGTGGGAFRIMYGDFLKEASSRFNLKDLAECGNKFIQIGQLWDSVGMEMMNVYTTGDDSIIDNVSVMVMTIAEQEEAEFVRLQNIIKCIEK
jgi:hypothetical protein